MTSDSPSGDQRPDGTTIDVCGIGNALVDVLVHETDAKLTELNMTKGAMALVDEEMSRLIYDSVGPGVEVSGGSVANTTVGVASFGGMAHYLGKVRDDQLGRVFAHDMRSTGVGFSSPPATHGPATGCCIILVTPDAQRTLNTYLGAAVGFGPDDLVAEAISAARVLFLEGYLFDPPAAQEAFRVAARIAHDAGRKVAISLSDSFCVDRHRAAFRQLVDDEIDILLCNDAEICSLYEVDTHEEAREIVRGRCDIAVITRSALGSEVVTATDTVSVPAVPVDHVVDTTGAGDAYAAGFLFGLARGHDLELCARLGSLAAAEVISHIGARPEQSLAGLAADLLR